MISALALLSVALLFGGTVLYSFGFAAFLFTALPAETAGPVIRRAFPHFYLFVIGCAALSAALLWHRDPLGAGYHITQSKIALGSGGWTGRGFMQGTQSRLNFLPEKHTDFIFVTLAEEFGFIGAVSLLGLYALVILFCVATALTNRDRFASLLTLGVAVAFFLYFAVNMAMVMGLMPVVGVPLPLVSYGGSAMLVLMLGFGLVQSAHVHKPR